MKLLILHRWIGVHGGGTESHIRFIIKTLINNHWEVILMTREGGVPLEKELPEVKITRISKNLFESDFSYENPIFLYTHTLLFMGKLFFAMVALTLKEGRFDIVSTHFATEGIAALIYRFFFKTPFVSVLEGYTPLEGKVGKLSNGAVTISKSDADIYQRNIGLKSTVTPIGVDRKRFRSGLDVSELKKNFCDERHKYICLTVCRLEPRKSLETLIRAVPLVLPKIPVNFLIAGEGIEEGYLKKLVQDLKLMDDVAFLGFVSDQDLPLFYNAADVFCLPTLYEGLGIVFLEAMACGLPIVSTNVSAVPEVVGEGGILVEPKNPELLSSAIVRILEDDELRKELSMKALKRSEDFDERKLSEKYVNFYSKISEGFKKGR